MKKAVKRSSKRSIKEINKKEQLFQLTCNVGGVLCLNLYGIIGMSCVLLVAKSVARLFGRYSLQAIFDSLAHQHTSLVKRNQVFKKNLFLYNSRITGGDWMTKSYDGMLVYHCVSVI